MESPPVRRAACDTCRRGKLRCDHGQPVCNRCRDRSKASSCTYRHSPFRRRRDLARSVDAAPSHNRLQSHTGVPDSTESSPVAPGRDHVYPNPGFLGSSSHVAIFSRLEVDGPSQNSFDEHFLHDASPQTAPDNLGSDYSQDGVELIKMIQTAISIRPITELVGYWLARGTNLCLAEPFVPGCVHTMLYLLPAWENPGRADGTSRMLYQNSSMALQTGQEFSTCESFSSQLVDNQARWETIGFFFIAASRAILDTPNFRPLYVDQDRRRAMLKSLVTIADRCLNICLSLDCMNDLQLILQFESFLMHTLIDGNQNYRTWRLLGDVTSSIAALGYHEIAGGSLDEDTFIDVLRKSAFARIYAADKNLAIFLGRPPRVNRRFCRLDSTLSTWTHEEIISYTANAKWLALCALLKEEVLELSQEKDAARKEKDALAIEEAARANWQSLPPQFRIEGTLGIKSRSPFERDFLLGVRLDYLHVLFISRFLLLRNRADTEAVLLQVSKEMLSLVVEAVIFKDQLVNAGTSLEWKVAYHGLPAAGIISLALLQDVHVTTRSNEEQTSLRKATLQDLRVLVAHIEVGAIVQVGEPNFVLCSRAAGTIKRILDKSTSIGIPRSVDSTTSSVPAVVSDGNMQEDWTQWLGAGLCDFEIDFWTGLAEHPTLSDTMPH